MSDRIVPGRLRRRHAQEGEPGARRRRSSAHAPLRPRGQLLVAIVLVGVVVLGGALLEGALGQRPLDVTTAGGVASGAWYCPHGGGEDWEITISVANPGSDPVQVRARRIASERAPGNERVSVPPGGSVELTAQVRDRAGATVLEYFGGHVAAGWIARTGGDEVGLAAEPCLAEAGDRWTLGDGTAATKDDDAFVVVMNPFAGDAVFTLEVLSGSGPPGNLSEWNDFVLPAGRSAAFHLDAFAEGDRVIGATVSTSLGRVAAGTLGITRGRGVRAAIGWPGPVPAESYLPGASDEGGSTVTVVAPEDRATIYAASIFGPDGSSLIDDDERDEGEEREQRGETAAAFDTDTPDPSTIWLRGGRDRPGFVATRRTRGPVQDLGAVTGFDAPRPDWIVFPSVGEAPQRPALVVTNPGTEGVSVQLRTLPSDGAPVVRTIDVPPGGTLAAPKSLLEPDPRAPVLVRSTGGGVVVATASTSQGREGVAAYAVSGGARIDAAWVVQAP